MNNNNNKQHTEDMLEEARKAFIDVKPALPHDDDEFTGRVDQALETAQYHDEINKENNREYMRDYTSAIDDDEASIEDKIKGYESAKAIAVKVANAMDDKATQKDEETVK